jgi:predicted RNA binding protein YcfA (HicA-like mRNA interferase family)
MADFYRELVAVLRANGCYIVRTGKGSHEIWFSPINDRYVTVPRTTNPVIRSTTFSRRLESRNNSNG